MLGFIRSDLYGGHTKMFLDVFAEERGVGKTDQVAYLLDTIIGLLQIISDMPAIQG